MLQLQGWWEVTVANQYDVVQGRQLWEVRAGDGTVVSQHATQQRAIDAAASCARQDRGLVVWYSRDGQRQGSTSYAPLHGDRPRRHILRRSHS